MLSREILLLEHGRREPNRSCLEVVRIGDKTGVYSWISKRHYYHRLHETTTALACTLYVGRKSVEDIQGCVVVLWFPFNDFRTDSLAFRRFAGGFVRPGFALFLVPGAVLTRVVSGVHVLLFSDVSWLWQDSLSEPNSFFNSARRRVLIRVEKSADVCRSPKDCCPLMHTSLSTCTKNFSIPSWAMYSQRIIVFTIYWHNVTEWGLHGVLHGKTRIFSFYIISSTGAIS